MILPKGYTKMVDCNAEIALTVIVIVIIYYKL